MAGIYPLPSTRTSDLLAQTRLMSQLFADQLGIQRLQAQISTGIRLTAPSDDAPAAVRGMALQRLLELKDQHQVNLKTSQSFLDATDTSVNSVAELLTRIRSTVQGSIGATASDDDREAAVVEIQGAIQQLLSVANQKFRDRYLFAGSRDATIPFVSTGNLIRYDGNEGDLQSYTDTDLLTATNVSGNHIFGAISPQVLGSVNLSPVTTRETRLVDLHGGQGISKGRIAVSDGTSISLVDITGAETLGDVADLIQANPPAGRTLNVRVTSQGLFIDIDDAPGTNLTIREVSGGTTAADLGILTPFSAGTGPIIGTYLEPRVVPTTRLANILGVRATAALDSAGFNNSVLLEALQPGAANNGVAIHYVDDARLQAAPGLNAGSETVTYSAVPVAARAAVSFSGFNNNLLLTAATPGIALNNVQIQVVNAGAIGNNAQVTYDSISKTLSIGIDTSGLTQVQTVISRINAEGTFTAAYDPSSPADGGFIPTATIPGSDGGVITGNTTNSGGDANTIFVNIQPGGTTANHVVAALQGNAQVTAQFDVRLDDSDTSSPAFAGVGFVALLAATTAGGSGTPLDQTSGLRIVTDGQAYVVDLSAAETVEDLLNAINTSGAGVLAQINDLGTGINVRTRVSGTDFSIGENGGTTATQLGLRSISLTTPLSELNHGRGVSQATGDDFTILRSDGTSFTVDLGASLTIGDVLDAINNNPANLNPLTQVTARLAAVGNGIELVDASTGAGQLQVQKTFGSNAAIDLGLVAKGQATSAPPVGATLTGAEINPQEVEGIFNTLLRLTSALEANSLEDIERAMTLLDQDYDRINLTRAEVGFRGRNLESLKSRMDDETIQVKDSLSKEIDTDYAAAISQLTARQAALEASLRLSAQISQLTLLNFL